MRYVSELCNTTQPFGSGLIPGAGFLNMIMVAEAGVSEQPIYRGGLRQDSRWPIPCPAADFRNESVMIRNTVNPND